MKKCKFFSLFILIMNLNSLGEEVVDGAKTGESAFNTDSSSCILRSNIYYIQDEGVDIILPLKEAKLRSNCDKKINYSEIEEEYNKLSKTRCDVISESKRGGCKETVGYINISYKNYSDIISGCGYYLKKKKFTSRAPDVDIASRESAKNCMYQGYRHHRYVFRISDPSFHCSKKTSSGAQCITKSNDILERATEFGNGWKVGNVIFSDNLGAEADKQGAENKCRGIGGELPTYSDIQSLYPRLIEVIFIRNGWLKEPYSNRDYFDKDPETKKKSPESMRGVAVRKSAYNVYCIKKL